MFRSDFSQLSGHQILTMRIDLFFNFKCNEKVVRTFSFCLHVDGSRTGNIFVRVRNIGRLTQFLACSTVDNKFSSPFVSRATMFIEITLGTQLAQFREE